MKRILTIVVAALLAAPATIKAADTEVIGKQHPKLSSPLMTAEALWAMGRIGTVEASPDGRRVYENATGNPAMALGGMGDLLAGVVGARWAYLGGDPFPAAAAAVWLHGAAGDSLVSEGVDPSLVNTARALGGLRFAGGDAHGHARPAEHGRAW